MGALDDMKDAAEATGKRVGEAVDDAKETVGDKVDEAKAEGNVHKAEAERDSVKAKNDYKEDLRSN